MDTNYTVKIRIQNPEDETEIVTRRLGVIFSKVEGNFAYGNAYYMKVGNEVYDIRYDKRFRESAPMEFIKEYFIDYYDGENGAWKLIGIEIETIL